LGSYWQAAAKRLTADSWSTIINDYYNRPTYKRPYYYIHNVNTSTDLPTNPYHLTRNGYGTDLVANLGTTSSSSEAGTGYTISTAQIKEAVLEALLLADSPLDPVNVVSN
jgi:hypothetical protein